MESGLLIRQIGSQDSPQGSVTITTDFGDYQEVDGVKFPHTIKIAGAMPVPMEAKMEEVRINDEIPEDKFSVE